MKLISKISILVVACIILSSCASEKKNENEKTNVLFPMKLESCEEELINFIEPSNSISLLSSEFDDNVKSFKLWVEVYHDGELILEQVGINFEASKSFDLAIKEQNEGVWDVYVRSEDSGFASQLIVEEKIKPKDSMLRAHGFLNYEVDIKVNESQIIGVYYFGDTDIMSQEASFYVDNNIYDIDKYDYVYVIRGLFSEDSI